MILSKIFGQNPAKKTFLDVLNEAESKFQNNHFHLVKIRVERKVKGFKNKEVEEYIESGQSVKSWIYSEICNVSGNLVESGDFHYYRGALSSVSGGVNLLKIFDLSTDELARLGFIDEQFAEQQKKNIRDNIKRVG